jgi:hypothetical protein
MQPSETKLSDGGREYGVLGSRRMDCIGRMVMRPTEQGCSEPRSLCFLASFFNSVKPPDVSSDL